MHFAGRRFDDHRRRRRQNQQHRLRCIRVGGTGGVGFVSVPVPVGNRVPPATQPEAAPAEPRGDAAPALGARIRHEYRKQTQQHIRRMAEPREQKCSTGPTGSRSRQPATRNAPLSSRHFHSERKPSKCPATTADPVRWVLSGRNPPNRGRTINLVILNFRMSPAPPSAAQLPQCSRLASNNSVRHVEQ